MVKTVLMVAEKPSIAKEISRLLSGGATSMAKTHSKYNPVYTFKCRLSPSIGDADVYVEAHSV